MTIDELYEALKQALDAENHEEECAYRCLNTECRLDHGCEVCMDGEFTQFFIRSREKGKPS